MGAAPKRWTVGRVALYAVHWAIIVNFAVQCVYAGYMVFVVIAPEGSGPLWERAKDFPFDQMVVRRLYASEFWIAMAALSIYLALTEIGPRLVRYRAGQGGGA